MKPVSSPTNIYGPRRLYSPRRVEKPHGTGTLGDKKPGNAGPAMLNARPSAKPQACHFETGVFGGTLKTGVPAEFIAQILGQILETNRADPTAAARAYGAFVNTEKARPIGVV
jgi:hypothetical protein